MKKLLKIKKIYFLLALIVVFSFVIRAYRIDNVPPSLTWDETAVGYNAFTIANYGRDEYGKILPAYFKSFGEDKQPIHIYIVSIFVKIFGLSEITTRIPVAIFGSLNVLLIFFLTRFLFKSNLISLASSFFLSISPQNIFFSRFNHEANFALFFLMLGILLFYKSIKERKDFLPLSLVFFLLSSITYHAAEIVVPLIMLLLLILYFKKIFTDKANVIICLFILTGFVIIGILNPQLLGITRYNQTTQGRGDIEKTEVFKKTNNYLLGRISLILEQYSWHFTPKYLFESGDSNPRLSSQGSGEFYKIDGLFLILGLFYLLKKRSKEGLLIFGWGLLGPLPSSLFAEAPHAGRAMFMMGSWQIIAALGFYAFIEIFRKRILKWLAGLVCVMVLFISLVGFFRYYFNDFPKRYAIDWQYGMKQIVEYIKDHPEYNQVFMTDERSQPYIFFLYYLKTPLPEYLSNVTYNHENNAGNNNVTFFDKYYFGGWNAVESSPTQGSLYILTSSQYDGLRFKSSFKIKKVIYYPNGTSAFYIVSVE